MLKYSDVERSYDTNKKTESKLRPHKQIPDIIKNKPQLDISLTFVWDSFYRLNTERRRDYGEIPWSCIERYADFYNFDQEEFKDFEVLIQRMDTVFLNHQQNQLKTASK